VAAEYSDRENLLPLERLAESSKQHDHAAAATSHARDTAPAAESLSPVLQLQQQAGNQAVQELLRSGYIQAKLAISSPDDPEEREADNVANTIMRKPVGAPSSRPCSCSHNGEMCEECRQKQSQPTISRQASAQFAPIDVPRIVSDVLRSPGHPLDAATRAFFEPRFGHDFSHVRVHTGPEAAASARSINALAYTSGSNVVFAASQYSPYTTVGQTLLAHELTHTIQQQESTAQVQLTPAGDSKRKQAAAHKARSGVTWEEALAVMNAIAEILPRLHTIPGGPSIELPGFPTGNPPKREAWMEIPDRYKGLVREWHFIVHPLITEPSGLQLSIYGSMREQHLNMVITETQPLVNELLAEGEASSTNSYLMEQYYRPVQRLREDVAEEVVEEAVGKAKAVKGGSFEELSESEKAKTLVEKAAETVHLATKVVNQFAVHAAHEGVQSAERIKLDEVFRDIAKQAGELPHDGVLQAAVKMSLPLALVQIEGGLHGVSALLAVADPEKRQQMFRSRVDLFGKAAVAAQASKLALQFAAGATALAGAGTYAVAKLLGKRALAADVLAKGVPLLEKLDTVISGVMVIHGALTLLDSEATPEEKEEAVLELGVGGATVLGKLIAGFEGGPAALSVVINFFTIRYIAKAAVQFSVDLVKISLNTCYQAMQQDAAYINDQALGLAIALQTANYETDSVRKNLFKTAADSYRGRLRSAMIQAIKSATVMKGARDKDPASHDPLLRRFGPLAGRRMDTDELLLSLARDYVQTVVESLAHPEEILNEDVEYVWEHYG
jgi:hypothetical protein